ncbi:hypothetical protein ONZ45_g18627 [Pleurotus djamor]|nr:hypothetical protein ONZ45_g18627 [Pleurotus djamor]
MTQVHTDAAAQELIDKEIALLEATIRDLKTRRNTHSAIAHLHDEILSLIFAACQFNPSKSWFPINQVCTHWRTVALNTPQLWTEIVLDDRDVELTWPNLWLQRAKSVPLDVTCYIPSPRDDSDAFWSLITQILSSNHCIRVFEIEASEFEPLVRLFTINANHPECPFLVKLQIRGPNSSGHNFANLGNWQHLPKLKSLTLCSLPIPTKLPFLPSLTHVNLISDHIPLSSVLHALEQMPVIEDIYVSSTINDNVAWPTLPIVLSHLKDLSISLKNSSSALLFTSLEFPHSASVLIIFEEWSVEGVHPPDLCSLALHCYKSLGTISIDMLDLQLSAVDDILEIVFTSKENGGRHQFTFLHDHDFDMTRYNPLFDTLPTESFSSLALEVEVHIEFIMDTVLVRFVHLRHLTLQVDPENPSTLTQVLERLLQVESDGDDLPPLPKLQSLTCSFLTVESLDVLESILSERRDLGIPLHTISIPRDYEALASHLAQFGITVDLISTDIL